jgi:hypothetical protein
MNAIHEAIEETTFVVPPMQTRALLPERAMAQFAVSITTLFGSDDAHDEAQRFTEFLSDKLGADVEVRVRHWSYAELQHLRAGNVAADLAQQTDILVLVTHAHEVLPPAVGRWVAAWLLQAASSSAAICLVGSSDATVEAPVACQLRNACEQAEVQFFVSAFASHARHQSPLETRAHPNLHRRLESSGIMHWGINE